MNSGTQPTLTIFSVPAPFASNSRVRQQNAITSWRRLGPECEILLFGGDPAAADYAAGLGIQLVTDVAATSLGTPLLSDVFEKARQMARGQVLMYSNCDMLYFDDLLSALRRMRHETYLMCGRRWDVGVPEVLDETDDAGWARLRALQGRVGRLHGPTGIDYFAFPRSLEIPMKPFVVGRPGWDAWLLWKMRDMGVPVIDATHDIAAVHQNHDYSHLRSGAGQYNGEERLMNVALAGGHRNMLSLREADWLLRDGSLIRPSGLRRVMARVATWRSYRYVFGAKRTMQYWLRLSGRTPAGSKIRETS